MATTRLALASALLRSFLPAAGCDEANPGPNPATRAETAGPAVAPGASTPEDAPTGRPVAATNRRA